MGSAQVVDKGIDEWQCNGDDAGAMAMAADR